MVDAAFDTLKMAQGLKDSGMEAEQAEAVVILVQDAINERVATKADLAKTENTLRGDMEKMETSLRGDIENLRGDMEKMEKSLRGIWRRWRHRCVTRWRSRKYRWTTGSRIWNCG